MKSSKILVFGAYGFLGSYLCRTLENEGYSVLKQGRKENAQILLDMSSECEVEMAIKNIKPSCVINLIAETDVDLCEKEIKTAIKANINVVEKIAHGISENTKMVHISTDMVYDGIGPQNEDNVNAKNVYSMTKFIGEKVALSVGATVLRTNFIGKSFTGKDKSFTDWLVRNIKLNNPVKLFKDVSFSPLYIGDLCDIIVSILPRLKKGVFNAGSIGCRTKAELGSELALRLNLGQKLISYSDSDQLHLPAKRPKGMVMDSSKFEKEFKIKLPVIEQAIEKVSLSYEYKKV